jgi:phosphoserine phosphatase RsbU/P
VATAARGIEEKVYQGVRLPLGRGFAGRVAATRQAQAIEDIDEADVVNPAAA